MDLMKKIWVVFLLVLLLVPQIIFADSGVAGRLKGRILLQVESHGEAWYLEPDSLKRAFLGRPEDAFQVMRDFGLGISEVSYNLFRGQATANLAGKILLRVEANGEAYYVNPTDLKMHYLGRPADAFEIMRRQGLGISNIDLGQIPVNSKYQGLEAVKAKVKEYIEANLLSAGQTIEVEEAVKEGDMYRVKLRMSNGQEIVSYVNNDLTKFFPQVMDMIAEKVEAPAPSASGNGVAGKTEVPDIELFVMSHCPYGIQMEKGLLPVLGLLGDKVGFTLEFVDYAMHGQKEIEEQMWQHCIQREGRSQLEGYLQCFVKNGDREGCLEEVGLSAAAILPCVSGVDEDYSIMEKYNDQSTWKSGRFPIFPVYSEQVEKYGVSGSPTLIVNGERIQTARDSASLLKAVCSAFENPPAQCSQELSSQAPAAGFGMDYVDTDMGGGCGS